MLPKLSNRYLIIILSFLTLLMLFAFFPPWETIESDSDFKETPTMTSPLSYAPSMPEPLYVLYVSTEKPSLYSLLEPLYGPLLNHNEAVNQMVVVRGASAGCFVFHDPKAWGMAAGAIYHQLGLLQVGDTVSIHWNTDEVDSAGCIQLRLFLETYEEDLFWTVFEEMADGRSTLYRFTPGKAYYQVLRDGVWVLSEPYQQ